jgi:cysteine desulfurase
MRPRFDVPDKSPYFDNGVTTRIPDEVVEAMRPYLYEEFADPGEDCRPGERAAEALVLAREEIADMVGAESANVWFTSGGTEANNWVVRCIEGQGIPVCSSIEHLSVLKPVEAMGGHLISVDGDGRVFLEDLESILNENKVRLVSVQRANQDTGILQDIRKVSELCQMAGVPLHVDACLSFGWERFSMEEWGADFITLSSHKVWGPVGCGALISSGKYPIAPFILGGAQEFGLRAGPVPLALVVGFHAAMKLMWTGVEERAKRIAELRDLVETDLSEVTRAIEFGATVSRLPNFSCLAFPGSDATFLAADLEHRYGMSVGVGGAAEAGSSSRVLAAMGTTEEMRTSALRFRFGSKFNRDDANQIIVGLSSSLREERSRPVGL